MKRFIRSVMVIARRDFRAILFSRSFLFFLLGPLFPVLVVAMAGGISGSVRGAIETPRLGIALGGAEANAFVAARHRLTEPLGGLPQIEVLARLDPGEPFDARAALADSPTGRPVAAVLTGSLDDLRLTGPKGRIDDWAGPVALLAREAKTPAPGAYPYVARDTVTTSSIDEAGKRLRTAQAAQTVLFLLTMLLAGMVLSNLVEEKANKIIEVLAAAVPMDAVFLGKLVAMLGVSFVGIAVWGGLAIGLMGAAGTLPIFAAPAVGWPMFLVLGVVYFAAAYLLLGSLFLTIGGLASTVREVQTLSMPVTMMQLLVFFFASYALGMVGEPVEIAATIFPLSSPFAMIARAAMDPSVWPHVLAVAWQAACVLAIVRIGSRLFRRTVMKSGPAKVSRPGIFRRLFSQA